MSVLSKLYTILTSDSSITDIVSTRITPVIAPQNETVPYVVYNIVGERESNTHTNNNRSYRHLRIQLDLYSTSYSQLVSLSANISNALLSHSGTLKAFYIDEFDDYDDTKEPKLYKKILEFYIQGND